MAIEDDAEILIAVDFALLSRITAIAQAVTDHPSWPVPSDREKVAEWSRKTKEQSIPMAPGAGVDTINALWNVRVKEMN